MIHFDCKPSAPLVWNLKDIPKETPFLCRLHLGLENPFFPLEDRLHFESLSFALKQWTHDVFSSFSKEISGVLLYLGSADFLSSFLWTEKALENFDIWKKERPYLEKFPLDHVQRLFTADQFVHYFQMLAHSLPDEVPIHLWLNAEGLGSLAQKHHILSQERFSHFALATKNLPFTNGMVWEGETLFPLEKRPSHALCFPEESMCDSETLDKLDQKMSSLTPSLRIIGEPFLTEEWEGVDVLYALKEAMTPQGIRKIKGFLATGGEVVFV